MIEWQNTGYRRSLKIRVDQEVLGQPAGDPIIVDGRTDADFLLAYDYESITPEQMARMEYDDIVVDEVTVRGYAQRFKDFIAFVRATHPEVEIEVDESLFVQKASGANNVIVESQGYYEDTSECPTEFGTCYLLEIPAVDFTDNDEDLYVTYQPPGGVLQDTLVSGLQSESGDENLYGFLCSMTAPLYKYGLAGGAIQESWTTDLGTPCYFGSDCSAPEPE